MKKGEHGEFDASPGHVKPLQFLHVYILREYLQFEFEVSEVCLACETWPRPAAVVLCVVVDLNLERDVWCMQSLRHTLPPSIPFDIERIIDDFVFMVSHRVEGCVCVGRGRVAKWWERARTPGPTSLQVRQGNAVPWFHVWH